MISGIDMAEIMMVYLYVEIGITTAIVYKQMT